MPKKLPTQQQSVVITENTPVAKDLWKLCFEAPYLASKLKPGQFFTIEVKNEPRQLVKLPLSFSGVNERKGIIETFYALIGPGTRALSKMGAGTKTKIVGPCGNGWNLDQPAQRILLVAGGSGLPSVLSAAHQLTKQNVPFDLLIGARSQNFLMNKEEFLTFPFAGTLYAATNDGSKGFKGNVVENCEELIKKKTYDLILTCGPPAMMEAMGRFSTQHKIACQVSLERRMTCGFGACATCAVRTKSGTKGACMAGPIFDAEEVLW